MTIDPSDTNFLLWLNITLNVASIYLALRYGEPLLKVALRLGLLKREGQEFQAEEKWWK